MDAHNLRVRKRIEQFQSTSEPKPCSIIVTNVDEVRTIDDVDKNSKRLSIASNSSVESARSDNAADDEAVNIEHGSSKFYVVWDD